MSEVPLVAPLGGLSDDRAKSAQAPATSPDVSNVRDTDQTSGRLRMGTREGMTRVGGPVNGSEAVTQIQVVQYDAPVSSFEGVANGGQVETWNKKTPLVQDCRALDVDIEGNRYCLDGRAGVVKFNKAGEQVWKFVLPVASPEHVCRALVVDDTGAFYVAVSAGYPQSSAKLWKFRAAGDGEGVPNEEWSVAVGGYVERLRLREGVLYAACNFTDVAKSTLRAYRLIDTAVPDLAWERDQVPYPINAMDVRLNDGAIATAHEPNSTRYYDPRSPDTRAVIVDWTPDRLTDWDKRKWCILDASDLDGDETANDAYETGDLAELWTDATGNNRNAVSYDIAGLTPPANCTSPVLNKSKAFAGQDTVQFFNPTAGLGNAHCGLVSLPNSSTNEAWSASGRTLIPAYTDAWFCVFMVLRVTDTGSTIRCPLGQVYPSSKNRAVLINANTTGGSFFTAASGVASLHQSDNAGPYAAYDTTNGFVVVSFTCKSDGSAFGTDLNSVNGTDCTNESFTGTDLASTIATQLGRIATTVNGTTEIGAGIKPFDGEIAYLLVLRDYLSSGSKTIIDVTEFEKIEGYLHWRFGIAHKLPGGHTYENNPPVADGIGGSSTSAYLTLKRSEQMVVKWDPNKASPRWSAIDDSTSTGTGGLGYECLWPRNGATDYLFTHGPKSTGTGGTTAQILTRESVVRRIKDNGDSVSITGTGTWEARWGSAGSAAEPSNHYPKGCVSGMAAESEQDGTSVVYLYLPVYTSSAPSTPGAYVYIAGGTAAGTNADTPESYAITLSSGARGYACAVDRYIPEYQPGLVSGVIDEYVTVGTPKEGSSDSVVWQLRLVAETRANTNQRGTYVCATAGTGFRHVTSAGAITTPSGTTVTLNDLNYVSIVPAYQKLWVVDNGRYYYVDPRQSDGFGFVWKSKSSGTLPPGCKIHTYWNERMVLGRGLDPSQVFMTEVGNPFGCDVAPPDPSGSEAVAFDIGEPVNALIPYDDDTLIIGTPTRRMVVSGDPARSGAIDRIGDVSGIAFGEAWCKDPEGRVYVFGSRGGVDVFGKGSISDTSIRRRLEDVDLSIYYVRLVWNWRAQGLHVFLVPRDLTTASTTAYFWSRRTGAWWKDELGFTVTSARLIDGDAVSRRAVYLGCSDGYVRRFDETATTDDGTPIRWRVVGGPVRAGERDSVLVARPRFTLAGELSGARVELLGASGAELQTVAEAGWDLDPTLTDAAPIRCRGANVWWRLSGVGPFGYEGGSALVDPMGIRRLIP